MSVTAAATRGESVMAYETKALLIAIGKIMKYTKDIKLSYKAVADMANAEGVILEPFEDEKDEATKDD